MDNKKFYILFLFVLVILLPRNNYAQKKGSWIGKVDVYSITMLHPYMIWYDPSRKAFKVSRNKENKQKIEQVRIDNQDKINEIIHEKNIIKENIQKEELRHRESIANLNKKYLDYNDELSTATIILHQVTYKQKIDKEDMEHKAKIYSLYGQSKICDEKIANLKYNLSDDFTTPMETEKRFIEIINDVKNYSKQVAEKKGIFIVLNSSYRKLLTQNNDKRKPIQKVQNTFASVLTTHFPDEELKNEGENAIINYYKGIETDTKTWLENGYSILGNATKNIVDEDILVGGTDLTEDVITTIYKNYKIDSNLTKAILYCLKK